VNIAEFKTRKRGSFTKVIDSPDDAYFDGKIASKLLK